MKRFISLIVATWLLPLIFFSCSPTPSITANVVLSTEMTDMKQIYNAEMAGENLTTNACLEISAGKSFFDLSNYYNRIDISYIKAQSLNALDDEDDVATYPDSLKGTIWEETYYFSSILVTDTLDFQTETSCIGTTAAEGDLVNTNITYTDSSGSKSGTLTSDSSASFYIIESKLYFNSVAYYRTK